MCTYQNVHIPECAHIRTKVIKGVKREGKKRMGDLCTEGGNGHNISTELETRVNITHYSESCLTRS
jgi:hypothetical protein